VIASEAHARLGLERVLFTPAAAPPHKQREHATPARLRLEMTALAIAGDERFSLCDLEIERRLVYTRDTMAALAARYPGYGLSFIMGSDSLLQFPTWHEPAGILELCGLAVAVRPGDDPAAVAAAAARWPGSVTLLEGPAIPISSSGLRARVAAGLPIRYLVPTGVETLIREQGLYVPS
jgi:nicotinate-nucleotide adenylyltransferase